MASSLVHRAMVYLGLADDDLDGGYSYAGEEEYTGYASTVRPRVMATSPPVEDHGTGLGAIRTIGGEEGARLTSVSPRPQVVRPVAPTQTSNVHVVMPERFKDAQKIADNVKANQPVIVNLQNVDRDLSRRMIDFCSGMTYVLGGSMEKVADQVFLVTPPNVEVPEEERQRLENGDYRG